MKRHGDSAGIDAAVGATVDLDSNTRDVEMAAPSTTLPYKKSDQDNTNPGVVDASSFHRSLGTRTTTKTTSSKPSPLLRDESLQRILTHNPVPFGSLTEAFAFAVFVIVFLLATAIVDQHEHGFFSNRVRAALVERDFEITIQQGTSSVQKQFVGIHDHADVWAFLQGPFLDAVYGTSLPGDADTQDTQANANGNSNAIGGTMMLSYNRVLGGVRLRSLRVQPDSCPSLTRIPEYASLVPFCYGRFDLSTEQTAGYGPILNSGDITAAMAFKFAQQFFADRQNAKSYADLLTCNSDCTRRCGDHYGVDRFRYTTQCLSACGVQCKCIYEQPIGFTHLCPDPNPSGANAALPIPIYAYNWSSASVTGASTATAYTAAYPGSGYVVDLPLNASLATQLVAQLKHDRFLDLATRALVIDFTVFNAYLQLFTVVQFVFEFPASGGVFASFSDVVIDLFQYSTPVDTTRIVLELVLVAFVAWRWKSLLHKWYTMGVRTYFASDRLWHTIECCHLAMCLVVIAFRLYVIDLSYGTLSGAVSSSSASPSAIPTFQSLARVREIDAILSSVNAALVWMHFLKYTQMSKRMTLLLRTLQRASADLVWFCVYVFTCLCAFAQIGYLLFGLQLARFRSLGVVIVTLLQAVAGDLEYATLVDAHRVLGPIYYVSFYLLLLLILLNVFLAIINDAYVQTLSEQEEQDDADDAALRLPSDTSSSENPAVESQLQRLERRELEQLRKYPFSKGITSAMRLLVADLKRSLYEMRTGKRIFKVDPMVAGMRGVLDGGSGDLNAISPGQRLPGGQTSRKLTLQVKRQLEKQMEIHERAHDAKRAEHDDAQRQVVETQQTELTTRLTTLVESNHEKTRRMDDVENILGSIEKLCQQLVAAAMDDVPTTTPKRPTTTAATAATRRLTGSNALSMALQRQKTAGKGVGKNAEGEIEEITL